MNIKNFTGVNAITTPVGQVGKVERLIKSEASHEDRDANGQQLYGRQSKKEKMTDEQFEKAISILKEKKFIKEMHWTVATEVDGEIKFAVVSDLNGALIRKISEFDLWELFQDPISDSPKGLLLKKTA